MTKLIIDTTDRYETQISIEKDGKTFTLKGEKKPRTQDALILISKALSENGLMPKDIDEVLVNEGPGSFTGIRVGVAIANAFGFSLNVPVNGQKSKIVAPKYF